MLSLGKDLTLLGSCPAHFCFNSPNFPISIPSLPICRLHSATNAHSWKSFFLLLLAQGPGTGKSTVSGGMWQHSSMVKSCLLNRLAGPDQGGGSRMESEEEPCFPPLGQGEKPTGPLKYSFPSHIGCTPREPACSLQQWVEANTNRKLSACLAQNSSYKTSRRISSPGALPTQAAGLFC